MTDAVYSANRIRLMSPVAFDQRNLPRIAWLILFVSIAFGLYLYSHGVKIVRIDSEDQFDQSKPAELEWTCPAVLSEQDWSIIRGPRAYPEVIQGEFIRRFRLAGTFFEFTARGSRKRLAIVEDRNLKKQHILREREIFNNMEVLYILRDHVDLRTPTGKEVRLSKSFSPGQMPAARGKVTVATDPVSESANRFGVQSTGKNSWVFKRDTLLDYYHGLRDEPERLVMVFDSLKPVYTPDGWIEGYRLGIEGERAFFEAIGLQEGDIVRRVNKVKMTNRRRAEFFIKQFVRNEATVFALDVEREGLIQKLTYAAR